MNTKNPTPFRASAVCAILAVAGLQTACTAPATALEQPAQASTVPQTLSVQPDWSQSAELSRRLRNANEADTSVVIQQAARAASLPAGRAIDFHALQLTLPDGSQVGFDGYLAENFVEGLIVLHRGRVVSEQYFNGMQPGDAHNWASMAKSVIGVLAVELATEGRLRLDAPLAGYVPELAGTPFGRATVQQNLDMQVALAYRPDVPPDLGIFTAVGLLPPKPGMPASIREFLATPQSVDTPHGSAFFYQNGSTEAVAWALSRLTGRPVAQVVSERLWQPMGAQAPAFYRVDPQKIAFAAGGLSSTLRDAARFAELVRNQGRVGNRQVLAPDTIRQILTTPSLENQAMLKAAERAGDGGTGYRNFWWHPIKGQGSVLANGRYGQRIYVDPHNELTIVQFGAYPDTRPRATMAGASTSPHSSILRTDDGVVALAQAITRQLKQ